MGGQKLEVLLRKTGMEMWDRDSQTELASARADTMEDTVMGPAIRKQRV